MNSEGGATRNPKARSIGRTLAWSVAVGAAIYIAIAAASGFREVASELGAFHWLAAAGALGLALLNYALRFVKWELYLRRLDVRVPLLESLAIFLSGFSLTMTPGKVGEVVRAYLLRERHGVAMARTAPTVLADRLTDLMALLALAAGGVGSFTHGRTFLWLALGLVALILVVVSWRGLVHALLDGAARVLPRGRLAKLREFYDASGELLRPAPLLVATALSVVAWGAECVAFWLVLRGFGAHASLVLSAFIYATMTIAGALSFLPGGVGVQEAGMIALCVGTAGLSRAQAAAATFVTRLCTLWFAIALGVVALMWVERHREEAVS